LEISEVFPTPKKFGDDKVEETQPQPQPQSQPLLENEASRGPKISSKKQSIDPELLKLLEEAKEAQRATQKEAHRPAPAPEVRKLDPGEEEEWDDWDNMDDFSSPTPASATPSLAPPTPTATPTSTGTPIKTKRNDFLGSSASSDSGDSSEKLAKGKPEAEIMRVDDFFDEDMTVTITPTLVADVRPPPPSLKPTRLTSLQDEDDDTDLATGTGGAGWDDEGEGWGEDEGEGWGEDKEEKGGKGPLVVERSSFNFDEELEGGAEVAKERERPAKPVIEKTDFNFDDSEEEEGEGEGKEEGGEVQKGDAMADPKKQSEEEGWGNDKEGDGWEEEEGLEDTEKEKGKELGKPAVERIDLNFEDSSEEGTTQG
jgi:hypothetical protein